LGDEREEIRARINIVDLVSQRVALKKAGKGYTGLCPFHQDRNPSFSVDPTTGRYRCWSCNESGDIFTWVMKTENVDFAQALQDLASRAGVELKSRKGHVPKSVKDEQRAIMHAALSFFRRQLATNPQARNYCDERGLDQTTLDTWEIGYAPDVNGAMSSHLKKEGISLSEARSLFLVDQDPSGGYYDRFRGRLMFPIRDERGDLVAFGGRIIGAGQPKYINSSDTPLFHKSRVLYGLNRARETISAGKPAVIVEGYMDVIACHRSGVTNAVAALGTSFGEDHVKLLKRWAKSITLLFDADAAGQRAALSAIELVDKEGLRVGIALIPHGKDPDTLLKDSGPEAVAAAVEATVAPVEFRLNALLKARSPDQEEFWEAAIQILAQAKQDMEIEVHLLKLAGMYPGLKDIAAAQIRLRRMVDQARRKQAAKRAEPARPVKGQAEFMPLQEPLSSAEIITFAALRHPSFQRFAWMTILQAPYMFQTGAGSELASAVAASFPSAPPEGPVGAWIHRLEPETMRQLLVDLLQDLRASNLKEDEVVDAIKVFRLAAERRELTRLMQNSTTPEDRLEIFNRLKRLKVEPDPDADEDEDPYA